jgi:hypothetical protein
MTASSISENATWYIKSACADPANVALKEAKNKEAAVLRIIFIRQFPNSDRLVEYVKAPRI